MPESLTTDNKKKNDQKPPLSRMRIIGEILAGAVAGLAVVLLMTACANTFTGCFGGPGLIIVFIARTLYGLVGGFGVYLIGSIGKQTGSLSLTLASGFLGGLLGTFVELACMGVEEIGFVLAVLIPPIFATYSFNLTRRYKEPKEDVDRESNKQEK